MSYTQRKTPVLAELCTHLVEDVYGELAARVYSILARHGRQSLAAIVRASYLSARQIKYGLVILTQQHLVFHFTSDAPVTYYEIDWQNSYALVRIGKVTKLVEDRFGRKAANVMSNLLSLGHTRIADLKEAYFPTKTESDDESDDEMVSGAGNKRKRANGVQTNGTSAHANGVVNGAPRSDDDVKPNSSNMVNGTNGTNGVHKVNGASHSETEAEGTVKVGGGEIASADELYDIIEHLIERGWIRTVTETQYLSPGDMHAMIKEDTINEFNSGIAPNGVKDKERIVRAVIEGKRSIRDEWAEVPKFSRRGTGSNKRVKINGANGYATPTPLPEDDYVIRVNPEKISVAMRTEQLVSLVDQRLGNVTAVIYRTMLRTLEAEIPRCFEEFLDPVKPAADQGTDLGVDPRMLVTARDIAKKLGNDIDICEGLDPNAIVQITRKGHVRSSNILSQPQDPSTLGIEEKTRIVDKHIQLLAEDPMHFVTWHSRAGYSQWHVEFETIAQALIQQEIENTISARKGSLGVKLVRALRKKGRLDERATCNVMMMSANDIRGIINDLTVQGFVQTQEIPKVERREAKHSLHLIWYDRQRAREKLLHDTYKGMVRILQRIAYERERVQPTISKAERSDVVGNEDKWLSKTELATLKKWKEVQEKLLLQLFREDDLVATLRDFHGPLVTS